MQSSFFGRFGPDLISFILSVALLVVYHLFLKHKIRNNPAYTIQAVNNIARAAWVREIMTSQGKEVLAVQTLRNSTMAATFIASTAVLLVMGTLTLSGEGDKLTGTWHSLDIFGAKDKELWVAKLLLLVIDFFVAFFNGSMAIRFFNHVGYMINVPTALQHKALTPELVAGHLNRAGRFYSMGTRAFYFSVPLVFWLFGPYLMLLSTLGLIVVLYRLDRAR